GSGARVMQRLGVERVVLARENTVSDILSIRDAAPTLGLETFVHGALCISYSGQCLMSGMISERSANRGSCAQSCRKDYVLTDVDTGATLDTGFLISAKDLAAHEHLAALADAGVGTLKVEGRKKKPEYVATVTHAYREWLDRLKRGEDIAPPADEIVPLVQIFSRGFTGGMLGGRVGRDYITRDQPDNRGRLIGSVVGREGNDILVDVISPIAVGDGLGFEENVHGASANIGCTVTAVRTVDVAQGRYRQALSTRIRVPDGWRVVRTFDATLMQKASASFAATAVPARARTSINVRAFGSAGAPLKLLWETDSHSITVTGAVPLAPASKRALDYTQLREQLGRLGETPWQLGTLDINGLAPGQFLPVSELNRMRQEAVEAINEQAGSVRASVGETRAEAIRSGNTMIARGASRAAEQLTLTVSVFTLEQAREAAANGATEVVFDAFLRHPPVPLARVRTLHAELVERGVNLRLRTPTIVRPEERRTVSKWLDLGLPLLSGHLGLIAEQSQLGRDVTADYATNVFNPHTAKFLFELGARRIVASVELTLPEIGELVAPFGGAGFDVLIYGRPEGMTIEHCVLSAAFDRAPTTCRDLCVQKHVNVSLTDAAGYAFPVATDSACRNRLLHSRPIDGAEYLASLWRQNIRGFQMVFNVPGDPVGAVTAHYREMLDAIAAGQRADEGRTRRLLHGEFTRGHFARAV
ncbi:MAG: U32 family peptidase, partial [Gemmatimonadota bacterium]|nr:U32 family peptidase [Gemmatimonadota bacterium]